MALFQYFENLFVQRHFNDSFVLIPITTAMRLLDHVGKVTLFSLKTIFRPVPHLKWELEIDSNAVEHPRTSHLPITFKLIVVLMDFEW